MARQSTPTKHELLAMWAAAQEFNSLAPITQVMNGEDALYCWHSGFTEEKRIPYDSCYIVTLRRFAAPWHGAVAVGRCDLCGRIYWRPLFCRAVNPDPLAHVTDGPCIKPLYHPGPCLYSAADNEPLEEWAAGEKRLAQDVYPMPAPPIIKMMLRGDWKENDDAA